MGVSVSYKGKKVVYLLAAIMFLETFAGCGVKQVEKDGSEIAEDRILEAESSTEEDIAENAENINIAESWVVKDYEQLDDIISVKEITVDEAVKTVTYSIRYKSDDCEVVSYLSIPKECLEQQKAYPCIIFNRGGNKEYGANQASDIAYLSESSGKIVFASQYRGVSGGTGKDEFGGADLEDVLQLVDLCEAFSFVDMDQLYMMGISRGGMMTYMAVREDARIKKAVVVSGVSDAFMSYDDRDDMKEVFQELVGGTPEELPQEYEKRSATYWAGEIKCPVLIIHSRLDEKVSYAEAEKMAQCLEDAGKEYQLVTYEDDIHGLHPEDFELIMEWCRGD